MKNNINNFLICITLVALLAIPAFAVDLQQNREREVKAAFLFNFINFVEWPEYKMPNNDEPIVIGVVGSKDFTEAFSAVRNKKVRDKGVEVVCFEDLSELKTPVKKDIPARDKAVESLKKCHILFISSDPAESGDNADAILRALKGVPVLIVGEAAGFLEKGGQINFLEKDQKIRFEINLRAVRQNGLEIRSKLLKLAKRVVQEDAEGGRVD